MSTKTTVSTKTNRSVIGVLAAGLAFTGLGAAPAQASPDNTDEKPRPMTSAEARTTQLQVQKVRKAVARAGLESRMRAELAKHGIEWPARPAIQRTSDELCQSETELSRALEAHQAKLTLTDRVFLTLTLADMLPSLEVMLAQQPSDAPLADTGKAKQLQQHLAGLQGFWDVDGSRIQLMGMSGQMLADEQRVQKVYERLLVPSSVAEVLAEAISTYVKTSPGLDGGRNPVFSFNAYAVRDAEDVQRGGRIAMGQGLLDVYDELGHGDVAPQVVLAHEYAHQVQYRNGMIDDQTPASPEQTRYTELHADASAGYYTVHQQGGRLLPARTPAVSQVLYGIGDCNLDSNGHHGTPAQRRRAGQWGIGLATADPGRVMGNAQLRSLYDQQLPQLLGGTAAAAGRDAA
ncbi:hypothetical protein [Luteococcus sp. OSA5]|uniref:hypothetical protein n=1 Tax=Luteococcus sp. OSA5 TaxID=3401630 RepID=UPI003B436548